MAGLLKGQSGPLHLPEREHLHRRRMGHIVPKSGSKHIGCGPL